MNPAPPSTTVAPRAAAPASRTRRRADRMRDFGAGALAVMFEDSILAVRPRRACPFQRARWGAPHYRALTGRLIFGNEGTLRNSLYFKALAASRKTQAGP